MAPDHLKIPLPSSEKTRNRLLEAAARVFSQHGIQGATTREIAREAGVNEVTLFRHFKSKEQLLYAVVERSMITEERLIRSIDSWTTNLKESLAQYAQQYFTLLEQKEALARAFLAEARAFSPSVQERIGELLSPIRAELIALLTAAKQAGLIRNDVDTECAVDAFKNSLYAALLRQSYLPARYSKEKYITQVVNIFVRGIEAEPRKD
ncbi:MAG: TetR/AcrR family transcriptional regulator [Verrucomicrobia bacterium]|nr:TetR/AcrR family transcriptional regulator [Verrucomicrobiota bacterium]